MVGRNATRPPCPQWQERTLVVTLGHRKTAWRNPEGRHHTEIRRMGGGGKEPVGERPTPPEAD